MVQKTKIELPLEQTLRELVLHSEDVVRLIKPHGFGAYNQRVLQELGICKGPKGLQPHLVDYGVPHSLPLLPGFVLDYSHHPTWAIIWKYDDTGHSEWLTSKDNYDYWLAQTFNSTNPSAQHVHAFALYRKLSPAFPLKFEEQVVVSLSPLVPDKNAGDLPQLAYAAVRSILEQRASRNLSNADIIFQIIPQKEGLVILTAYPYLETIPPAIMASFDLAKIWFELASITDNVKPWIYIGEQS